MRVDSVRTVAAQEVAYKSHLVDKVVDKVAAGDEKHRCPCG